MRGVLLDPRTGQPEVPAHVMRSLEVAPAHVLASLERARLRGGFRASRQNFRELMEPVPFADLATVTPAAATETVLWPVATWTPLPAGTVRPGQVYYLTAFGVMTTPATAANTLAITPRYGTSTAGVTFGVSATSAAMTVSLTGVPWFLQAQLHFRTVRNDAASSTTAACTGTFWTQALASAIVFGNTVPTNLDTTTAQGLVISVTPAQASTTFTPRSIAFEAVN